MEIFIVLEPKEGTRVATHAPLCNTLPSNNRFSLFFDLVIKEQSITQGCMGSRCGATRYPSWFPDHKKVKFPCTIYYTMAFKGLIIQSPLLQPVVKRLWLTVVFLRRKTKQLNLISLSNQKHELHLDYLLSTHTTSF